MSKTVTLICQAWEGKKTHNTNASTWGELKAELGSVLPSQIHSNLNKMQTIIKGEGTELSVDSAKLPSGNFGLFFFQKDSKAAAGVNYTVTNQQKKKFDSTVSQIKGYVEKIEGLLSTIEDQMEYNFTPISAQEQREYDTIKRQLKG